MCTDPVPPLYDFLPGIDRFRTDPDPTADYDLLVISDCGSLERIGAVAGRHAELFARLPRVIIDHHASNDAAEAADWIDPAAAATCEMVALLAGRLGVRFEGVAERDLASVLMGGIVMDTATFAHPNATPRTLAVAAALVDAGAPLSDISRRLYRSKPEAQLRLFGRVLDRLESLDGGRVVWSTLLDADLAATGTQPPQSEGIIDLLAQADEAEVAILFKEAGAEHADQRPDEARRGRRDRADGAVRRWRPRPGRRRHGGPCRSPTRGRSCWPRRSVSPPTSSRPARLMAHSSLGPGLDGILVVDKPIGPTSHDIVGLVRRLAATKRVGHGGTLDPFASGRAPGVPRQGDAGRRVPPRRSQGLPGDGLLRGVVHDR